MNDDELMDLLNDPAVWAEPSPDLQKRITASIAAEAASARPRRWRPIAAVAAVAGLIFAFGAGAIHVAQRDDVHRNAETYVAALAAPTAASDVSGTATLVKTQSGWRIRVQAQGLPRRQDGQFYEAWLKNASGVAVSIGTFNDGRKVVLWAGVSPEKFGTLTVTKEEADGVAASSGHVVLIGHPVEKRTSLRE